MNETKDRPVNMPCSDPEGCKHFKAEMKLGEQFKALEKENERLRKDLAHEIDMNAQGRARKLDIDDLIDNFISELDFDHVVAWAKLLDVEVNYPPIDDMYPDWEDELAVEVGDAMRKVGEKSEQKPLGTEMADAFDKIIEPKK